MWPDLILENVLTVCRRQMFSRREPTQPQKVMKNMRTPTINSIIAGSTVRHARAASGETENNLKTSNKVNYCESGSSKHVTGNTYEIRHFNVAFPVSHVWRCSKRPAEVLRKQ